MKDGLDHSIGIEKQVLGICILEGANIFVISVGILESKYFYNSDHEKIYEALCEMYKEQRPIEILTVYQYMVQKNYKLNTDNIAYYLTTLTEKVTSSTTLVYHCNVLRGMWKKRAFENVINSAKKKFDDPDEAIFDVQKQLDKILGESYKKDWYSMNELVFNLMKHQADIASGTKSFLSTGLESADRLNGGFAEGHFVILAARPSVGKSAFMGKMAVAMARKKKKVGIISLEMDNNQIAGRLASLETDISFQTIYRNLFLDEKENERFYDIATRHLVNLPIFVSDKTQVNVDAIKAKASRLINTEGCDIIFVDYLQLVEPSKSNKNYNREQEVARISRGLKMAAMEFKIPFVLLCQLNRSSTTRTGDKRYPQLSDLRESGAIEQDADIVFMLHRDWCIDITENENGESTERDADLLCLKWRNGSTFHRKLDFEPTTMKFSERRELTGWTPVQKAIDFSEPRKNTDDND
jgi:replicative DNA helicase